MPDQLTGQQRPEENAGILNQNQGDGRQDRKPGSLVFCSQLLLQKKKCGSSGKGQKRVHKEFGRNRIVTQEKQCTSQHQKNTRKLLLSDTGE